MILKISILTNCLNLIDIAIRECPNIYVFGLTTEGEEITQPCPTGRGFFWKLAYSDPVKLEVAQQ